MSTYVQTYPAVMAPLWGSLLLLTKVRPFTRDKCSANTYTDWNWRPQILSGYHELVQRVVEMLEKIGQSLPRLDRYIEVFPDEKKVHDAVCQLYTEILSFSVDLRRLFKHRDKGTTRTGLTRPSIRHFWDNLEQKFQDKLSKFEMWRKEVESEVQAAAIARANSHFTLALKQSNAFDQEIQLSAAERQHAVMERLEAGRERADAADARAQLRQLVVAFCANISGIANIFVIV